MDLESVHRAAKGRIWSGEDARTLGLVDLLGGFQTSVEAAKAAAGIPEDRKIGLKFFPRPQPFWRRMLAFRSDIRNEKQTIEAEFLEWIQPMAGALYEAGLTQPAGILQMRERIIE